MAEKSKLPENMYPDKFPFISLRREKGGGFVFNPFFYNEEWIDDIEIEVLEYADGKHNIPEIVKAIAETHNLQEIESEKIVNGHLSKFASKGTLKYRNEPNPSPQAPNSHFTHKNMVETRDYYSAPNSVLFDVTYRCNMVCKHCLIGGFPKEDEMNLYQIQSVLAKLKEAGVFRVHFSGGEPLIRKDIFDILKIASDLNFGITLSSNGLLLNDRVFSRLKELDVFCFQVSLDGIGKTHDDFRGVEGAYEKAVAALKTAASMGFYTVMSTTIIPQNLNEISRLLDLAVSLGVSSFKLNEFMPVGRGQTNKEDLTVIHEQLRKLAEEMTQKEQQYEGKIEMHLGAVSPWLLDPEQISPPPRGINASCKVQCSAGYATLVIAPFGEVYPCPYLTDFPLGNILTEPLEKIWNNNSGILGKFRNLHQEDIKGKCKTCRHTPKKCNGGCRAAAYIANGDILGEDSFCWKPTTE